MPATYRVIVVIFGLCLSAALLAGSRSNSPRQTAPQRAIMVASTLTGVPPAMFQAQSALSAAATEGSDASPALQALIDAAGRRGTVNIPPGIYELHSPLVVPQGCSIPLIGAGVGVTVLQSYRDTGAGTCAVKLIPGGTTRLDMENLTLQGPNLRLPSPFVSPAYLKAHPSQSLATLPSLMDGVDLTDTSRLVNVNITGYHAAVLIDGNHQTLRDVTANGYYGVYFVRSQDDTYFDQSFDGCNFGGCRFASVACAPDSKIGGCTFLRCHIGFCPVCFYREAGVTGRDYIWISSCNFQQCQFEGPGISDFWDADGISAIIGNTFNQCGGFDLRYGFPVPGLTSDRPAILAGSFSDNLVMEGGPWPWDSDADMDHNTWEGIAGNLANETRAGLTSTVSYAPALRDDGYSPVNHTGVLGAMSIFGPSVDNVVRDGGAVYRLMWTQAALPLGSLVQQAPDITSRTAMGYDAVEAATGVAPVLGVVASVTHGETGRSIEGVLVQTQGLGTVLTDGSCRPGHHVGVSASGLGTLAPGHGNGQILGLEVAPAARPARAVSIDLDVRG